MASAAAAILFDPLRAYRNRDDVQHERRPTMRSIVAILALLAPLAAAQAPAAPQPMTPIAKPPSTAPAAPAATAMPVAMTKPAPAAKARHWKKADARVCLEFPNDMQIIKCSENYR